MELLALMNAVHDACQAANCMDLWAAFLADVELHHGPACVQDWHLTGGWYWRGVTARAELATTWKDL